MVLDPSKVAVASTESPAATVVSDRVTCTQPTLTHTSWITRGTTPSLEIQNSATPWLGAASRAAESEISPAPVRLSRPGSAGLCPATRRRYHPPLTGAVPAYPSSCARRGPTDE